MSSFPQINPPLYPCFGLVDTEQPVVCTFANILSWPTLRGDALFFRNKTKKRMLLSTKIIKAIEHSIYNLQWHPFAMHQVNKTIETTVQSICMLYSQTIERVTPKFQVTAPIQKT